MDYKLLWPSVYTPGKSLIYQALSLPISKYKIFVPFFILWKLKNIFSSPNQIFKYVRSCNYLDILIKYAWNVHRLPDFIHSLLWGDWFILCNNESLTFPQVILAWAHRICIGLRSTKFAPSVSSTFLITHNVDYLLHPIHSYNF